MGIVCYPSQIELKPRLATLRRKLMEALADFTTLISNGRLFNPLWTSCYTCMFPMAVVRSLPGHHLLSYRLHSRSHDKGMNAPSDDHVLVQASIRGLALQ